MNTKIRPAALVASIAVGALTLSGVPAASADSDQLAATQEVVVRAAASAGASVASTDGELDVIPATDAAEGVVVRSDNLAPLTIPLPEGLSLDSAEATDSGSTVYSADQGSVDVAVEEVARSSPVEWCNRFVILQGCGG